MKSLRSFKQRKCSGTELVPGNIFKKKEYNQAEREAMNRSVTWVELLTAAIIVPLLILLFGAQYFFPHNDWVQKYLGDWGTRIIISCIFVLGQFMGWRFVKLSKRAKEEKKCQEQREREIGKIK